MKKAIVGKKIGMTQVFTDDGRLVPVTVVEAGPCKVVQKKTIESDGYEAVQVGFDTYAENRAKKLVNKPMTGHFKKAGVAPTSIRTWDDFDAACEKLVAAGITPLAIGGSVGGNLAGLLGSVAPTFWTDEGAKYDLGDSLKDGTFDFDTYATELYEYLATWMKKGYINEDVLTLDAAGAQQMLGSGEAAFMVRGTDNITVARQYYPDANMGVLPLPSSADGAPSFRVGEGDAWGVWKDTENEAACWALLDYLARPEVGSKWATVSGALPTVEGADAADVYTLNCYKQAVEDCNGKVQYDNLFDRKFFPSGMWGIMADSMSMMLSNPDDVTEAVEYLRDNYLELYAEQNG